MAKELSQRVKELCSERGIQLKDLAERMNVKPESLSRAINGNPHLSTLENIANALNVGVAELLTGGRSNIPATTEFLAVVIDQSIPLIFHSKAELKKWLE